MTRIPLALLPGTLCTATLWQAQVAALSNVADVRVIDTARHDDLTALAQHVHQLMPARFAVAGLSYGGIVAFAVWRQKPQAISHMGLLNTTPLPVTPQKRASQIKLAELARSGEFQKVTADHVKNVMLPSAYRQNIALKSKISAMAAQVGIDGFTNQIKAQINRPDSRPILGQIDCPTLILTGQEDQLCPPAIHRQMAEQIRHRTLHIVLECGHLSVIDRPEYVSQVMRQWLSC